jgi:hypothetical protein
MAGERTAISNGEHAHLTKSGSETEQIFRVRGGNDRGAEVKSRCDNEGVYCVRGTELAPREERTGLACGARRQVDHDDAASVEHAMDGCVDWTATAHLSQDGRGHAHQSPFVMSHTKNGSRSLREHRTLPRASDGVERLGV